MKFARGVTLSLLSLSLVGWIGCDPGQQGAQGSPSPKSGEGGARGKAATDPVDAAIAAARKDGRYVYQDPGGRFDAVVHRTGAVSFRDHAVDLTPTEIRLAGPEAWDPAKSSGARRKFLERTAEARAELAAEWNDEAARVALQALNEDLNALWERSELSAQRRRAVAFEWWDDTAQGAVIEGMSAVDAARHAHAAKARSTILSFLRDRSLTDSTAIYPADELEALNARRHSKASFDPGLQAVN